MAEQVQTTIVQIDSKAPLDDALIMSFPTNNIRIEAVNNSSIANSVIDYKGVKYYAQETATALTDAANLGGSSSYLVYTANLTQTGTNAPVATVLQNTLGIPVTWVYSDTGDYYADLTGVSGISLTNVGVYINQPPFSPTNRNHIYFDVDPDPYVFINTQESNGTDVDNQLASTYVRIEVYT